MPHSRHRHLSTLLQKTLRYSPITGIFGHRQVGKTTLANTLAGQYITLDQIASLDYALRDPEGLLSTLTLEKPPLVIDECQLAPPLFPALKEHVRTHTKPGQFLLTGSVRFSSRKAIRESLTGRLIAWELLPMDLSELHEEALPSTIDKLLHAKTLEHPLKPSKYFSQKTYREYLEKGGLPGMFSIRDLAIREQKFETQLNTILERDLKLLTESTLPYSTLKLLLTTIAQTQGEPLDLAYLSRQSRISVPTTKKLLLAFEAMFLIRRLKTIGTEAKPVLFLEDQGEASYLTGGNRQELADLLRFCFANIRVQLAYRSELKAEFFQYRNRGGAHIPLAVQTFNKGQQPSLGFVPILGSAPTQHDLASAYSFIKKCTPAKVLFVSLDEVDRVLAPNLRVVCIGQLI